MAEYVAILHENASGDYFVSMPDFPGFISSGRTFEQALKNTVEGLLFHIKGMSADGLSIPVPSKLSDLLDDEEYEVDFKVARA